MNRLLSPGEPVPWFRGHAVGGRPDYSFDTAAGRWIVMLFVEHAGAPGVDAALVLLHADRDLFDDERACFFGVTSDPADAASGRVRQLLPGVRWFLDAHGEIARGYGAQPSDGDAYQAHWLLLDPMLRVCARADLAHGARLLAELRGRLVGPMEETNAPVLVVRGVLPPDLCHALVADYERHGGTDSGFMREERGVTIERRDHAHKRRHDHHVTDEGLLTALRSRLTLTLRPMIRRAFQFEATRIERWLVSCYDGADGGMFRAHRDNTTRGTAHRKFACTINLNAGEYDGGELCFPEFGRKTYCAGSGSAIVFSCSLLHEARPVTRGRRFAFLPFLYDEAGAGLRERSQGFVAPELRGYRAGI